MTINLDGLQLSLEKLKLFYPVQQEMDKILEEIEACSDYSTSYPQCSVPEVLSPSTLRCVIKCSCKRFDLLTMNWKIHPNYKRLKQPSILRHITHINFTELIHMNLHSCGINNIQGLTFLNTQKLRQLYLENNNICSINSLGKCRFQFLKIIRFSNNSIVEIGNRFHKMKMSNLVAIHMSSTKVQDFRLILKSQNLKNKTLRHGLLYQNLAVDMKQLQNKHLKQTIRSKLNGFRK